MLNILLELAIFSLLKFSCKNNALIVLSEYINPIFKQVVIP